MQTLILGLWFLVTQESPGNPDGGAPEPPAAVEPAAETNPRIEATQLKDRIHGLRRDLLGGGKNVREAESEALTFYRRKYSEIQKRLDSLRADQVAAQAEYDSLLDSMLGESDPRRSDNLARRARRKASEVEALEARRQDFEKQREMARDAVAALQGRIEDRNELLADFDAGAEPERRLVLAPGIFRPEARDDVPEGEAFDRSLLLDLAERDPLRARKIIFARAPELYWELWPLRPPEEALLGIAPFPRIDPPGGR